MLPRITFIVALFLASCLQMLGALPQDIQQLIDTLDVQISQRNMYLQQKEQGIASLRNQHLKAATYRERFYLLGQLLDEYDAYNTDSALAVCRLREEIAAKSKDTNLQLQAKLTTANTLSILGMYKEALEIADGINPNEVTEDLKRYYYHVYRATYGLMADYALRPEDKHRYFTLTDQYRDSLLTTYEDGTVSKAVVVCDQLNAHGHPQQGIDSLMPYMGAQMDSPRALGIPSYTLSESYRMLGDTDNQMRQLLISAIGDMQSGTKEYISLRKLAILLYEQGDIDHAYQYLRLCMDDAVDCNARMRMLEVNQIFKAVNETYLGQIESQRSHLRWALVPACIFAALLAGALFWLFREMRTLSQARKELASANEQLIITNQALKESSSLKQEYIAQYMDQCSVYIDRLDHYRKSLAKIAKSGSIEELKKYNKSLGAVDEEIRSFYASFDETFLKMFPTFVEDFNALLQPDEQIQPKTPGQLNTELRIFALIRLGITDSAKIAQFLRYSVATIYTYRTRIRNKALGDRDRLEEAIMTIGKAQ